MSLLSTSPLVKTYTLDEFWNLEEPKDGAKLELIAGVLYMTPPPDFAHNLTSSNLNRSLYSYLISANDKGVVFTPRAALWTGAATYVEPDLFYVSAESLKTFNWKRPHTADLVFEIISPGTAIYDRNTKADTYAALGVTELWLIDPEHLLVEVRHLQPEPRQYDNGIIFQSGELIRSQVLPDFTPSVDEICRHALAS